MKRSFTENIKRLNSTTSIASCPTVTFQVTDDCCLACSYCYQIDKGHSMMSHETMKQCMDLLFRMYEENKKDTFINHNTKGLVLEFIGGEPFMNIDTIHYGSKYFLDKCIQLDHPWLTNFRFHITTNGVLYFQKEVQDYLNLFNNLVSVSVTVDGPKELHDSCRVDHNGVGSFDVAFSALKDQIERGLHPNTKITIAPENLPYLEKIVDFFISSGIDDINANPIFEHEWTIEEGKIYYNKLKILANQILEHPNVSLNIFNQMFGRPLLTTNNTNWCGGVGYMLAFDPKGDAYPCIRYMRSSLGNSQPPLIIGDSKNIYQDKKLYEELKNITRRSQSTDECFNCPVAGGCAWCSAWNYQKFGTCNKRDTNICWMHRAKSLANSYYYNYYYRQQGSEKRIPIYLPREIALNIIDNEEYDKLLQLSWE